jgi:hypothetical protein
VLVVLAQQGKVLLVAQAEGILPLKLLEAAAVGQVLSALMALELLAVMVAQVRLVQFLGHRSLMQAVVAVGLMA